MLTSFRLKNVAFTGSHQGGIGVSGTYMDISGAKNTIFDGIRVSLSGQAGFDPSRGTGGGFFVFNEGGSDIQILNSEFNEAGFSGSFIILYVLTIWRLAKITLMAFFLTTYGWAEQAMTN